MKFSLEQVGTKRHCISLVEKRLFLKEEGIDVQLAGDLVFSRRAGGDKAVALQGEMTGHFVGQCSFCATDVPFSFREKFVYSLFVGRQEFSAEREVECDNGKEETLFLSSSEIDLDEILREQICLNLPLQLVCRQGCRGLCPGCGVNLNNEECCCDKTASSSPFAVLSKLKKYR